MKLYTRNASNYCFKTEWALFELGIDNFERIPNQGDHDVEGMEHHVSPPTLRAIQGLTERLRRRPALLARLENRKA